MACQYKKWMAVLLVKLATIYLTNVGHFQLMLIRRYLLVTVCFIHYYYYYSIIIIILI